MAERKTLSKRLRFEIFKRDGFRCLYCGATPVQKVLRVDHVVPVAEGGSDDPANLATSCFDCNAGKGAVPLEQRKLEAGLVTEAHREHAEQIREWLAVQRDVNAAKEEALDQVMEEWERRVGTAPFGLRARLWKMIEEFGLPRLVEAFEIVAAKDLPSERKQVMYLHGILRRWREETAQASVTVAESASQHPDIEKARAALARALEALQRDPAFAPPGAERRAFVGESIAKAIGATTYEIRAVREAAFADRLWMVVRGLQIEVDGHGSRGSIESIPGFDPAEDSLCSIAYALSSASNSSTDPAAALAEIGDMANALWMWAIGFQSSKKGGGF